MTGTFNFSTLKGLCFFIKENNIDVYSEDVKYLGRYIPENYEPGLMSPSEYTIKYEDHSANVGLVDSHYVEDFSED